MKENSIEEDIKIIEYNMKCIRNVMNNFEDKLCENMQIKTDEVSKIIYNILSDYKRVLKENEELKNNTRKNENELEFDVDCDWIALQKILDESEKSNEYISYKNEKWIKEKYCIPIQKVKEKIRKNEEIIDISNDGDLIHELLQKNKVYEELLESEK